MLYFSRIDLRGNWETRLAVNSGDKLWLWQVEVSLKCHQRLQIGQEIWRERGSDICVRLQLTRNRRQLEAPFLPLLHRPNQIGNSQNISDCNFHVQNGRKLERDSFLELSKSEQMFLCYGFCCSLDAASGFHSHKVYLVKTGRALFLFCHWPDAQVTLGADQARL